MIQQRFLKALVFVLVLLAFPLNALADRAHPDDVKFRWAFGAIVGPADDRQLLSVTGDTALKSGDEIKMLVELESNCSVYLFHENAKSEVRLLFPYPQSSYNLKMFTKYYVPMGDQWFELDHNVGSEKIYLMVSNNRLKDLEELYEKYRSAADPAIHKELGKQFLSKMKDIRKERERLTIAAERPTLLGGTLRGIKGERPDLQQIAVQISGSDFYSRTFTIDHR